MVPTHWTVVLCMVPSLPAVTHSRVLLLYVPHGRLVRRSIYVMFNADPILNALY